MGWGFWTEYYAMMKEEYNEYLCASLCNYWPNNLAARHLPLLSSPRTGRGTPRPSTLQRNTSSI